MEFFGELYVQGFVAGVASASVALLVLVWFLQRTKLSRERKEALQRLTKSRADPANAKETLKAAEDYLEVNRERDRIDRVFTLGMGLLGLISLAYVAVKWALDGNLKFGSLLIAPAFAQQPGGSRVEIGPVLPWIAIGIFVVMAAAFLGALYISFWTEDKPENQSRIKSASDIVKTFGGFFTGLATNLLH